ncbi:sulfotransferase [Methylomarinum sp. Ch1-1]|uniref:Sulfotransferase n=1 Tax=Methylomarinum roseum TaxID=3067653 RepID=A0AAU7NPK3_9GAMM|nr:sulfotransferase [Methylomarinum sp. Ch1-1]MDP4521210.1 sulfotransferase [Methylomarinum sp. Ch1-1]
MNFGSTLLSISNHLPWRVSLKVRSILGVIPDFFIMGFPKCGTTSLYNYLIQHPEVMKADGKEQWYFSTFPIEPIEYYKFRYPFRIDKFIHKTIKNRQLLLGDGTPDYIFREKSIKLIKSTAPNAKIIILVRNPIKRSYSYYKHEKRACRINQKFEQLVQYEYNMFKKKGILLHENLYSHPQLKDTFLLGSIYSEYLEILLKYFDINQILLIDSETLFNEPKTTYKEALHFLELEDYDNIEFKAFNSGNYNIKSIPCNDFLKSFYTPYNKKLKEMFSKEFSW